MNQMLCLRIATNRTQSLIYFFILLPIKGPGPVCFRRIGDVARVLQGDPSGQGRRAQLEESHLQDYRPSRRAGP